LDQNRCACWIKTIAPVYHKPLRRFITPIGLGDKVIRLKWFLGFSVKPFLKRLALQHTHIFEPIGQVYLGYEIKAFTCKSLLFGLFPYIELELDLFFPVV